MLRRMSPNTVGMFVPLRSLSFYDKLSCVTGTPKVSKVLPVVQKPVIPSKKPEVRHDKSMSLGRAFNPSRKSESIEPLFQAPKAEISPPNLPVKPKAGNMVHSKSVDNFVDRERPPLPLKNKDLQEFDALIDQAFSLTPETKKHAGSSGKHIMDATVVHDKRREEIAVGRNIKSKPNTETRSATGTRLDIEKEATTIRPSLQNINNNYEVIASKHDKIIGPTDSSSHIYCRTRSSEVLHQPESSGSKFTRSSDNLVNRSSFSRPKKHELTELQKNKASTNSNVDRNDGQANMTKYIVSLEQTEPKEPIINRPMLLPGTSALGDRRVPAKSSSSEAIVVAVSKSDESSRLVKSRYPSDSTDKRSQFTNQSPQTIPSAANKNAKIPPLSLDQESKMAPHEVMGGMFVLIPFESLITQP